MCHLPPKDDAEMRLWFSRSGVGLRFWNWSTLLGSLLLFSLLAVVEQIEFAPHQHGSLRSFALSHSCGAEAPDDRKEPKLITVALSTVNLFGSIINQTESLFWDLKSVLYTFWWGFRVRMRLVWMVDDSIASPETRVSPLYRDGQALQTSSFWGKP